MLASRLLLIWITPHVIWGATHWLVTEDGRIQAQMDSMFQLARPHDLVALIDQEERVETVETLRQELFQQKAALDRKDDDDKDGQLEERLYATDADCIEAGKKLSHYNLHESTFVALESKLEFKSFGDEILKPYCRKVPLPFSSHSFEHLEGVRERASLVIEPEFTLGVYINDVDVEVFGSLMAHSLEYNETSWEFYNYAALYWRIKGNAPEAMECIRRALHFSPREFKVAALVQLGNILDQTQRPEQAAIVVHAAVDHAPLNPIAQYTLGNIYAVLGDFNRSVVCFENVLKLSPEFEAARKKKHAVLCLEKLEKSLETQHNNLQQTLNDLKEHQKKFELWNSLQEKVLSEQAQVGDRLKSQLEYQEYRFRNNKLPAIPDCQHYEQDGFMFFQCNVKQDSLALEKLGNAMLDLQKQLVGLKTQADIISKITEQVSKRLTNQTLLPLATTDGSSFQIPFMDGCRDSVKCSPSMAPKYPKKKLLDTFNDFKLEKCQSDTSKMPEPDDIPSVVLLPDNKGFNMTYYLSDALGLRSNDHHALPWYPPICSKLEAKIPFYDKVPAIKARGRMKIRTPDSDVQKLLLEQYHVAGNLISGEEGNATAFSELGQRILTAMKKKVAAPWLLHILAGLYWRAQGNAYNGIECFRHAITEVPLDYKDTVLTNLAALLLKLGKVDDAFQLTKEAYDVDASEPSTNFLLGTLHALKGNLTSASRFYARAAHAEPLMTEAKRLSFVCRCIARQQLLQANEHHITETCQIVGKPNGGYLHCTQEPQIGHCHAPEMNIKTPSDDLDFLLGISAPPPFPQAQNERDMGVVAKTDDESNDESTETLSTYGGPKFPITDDILPEGILRVGQSVTPGPISLDQCGIFTLSGNQFVSTWLSFSARQIHIDDELRSSNIGYSTEPHCDPHFPVSMLTWDHIAGVRHRQNLACKAETGLKQTLLDLAPSLRSNQIGDQEGVELVGSAISEALERNTTSWVLATAASLYWRVQGDAQEAVSCLRIALHFAPYHMKVFPLVSLANVLHRAGLHDGALIAANMALEIAPSFAFTHFTMANIHHARDDMTRAIAFYQSTLALQPRFETARERLLEIQCKQALHDY